MDLIFNNHIVKVINRDSEPFFYGSELAKMLNYARPGNAVASHVSEENKIKVQSLDRGLRALINEIGVSWIIQHIPNACTDAGCSLPSLVESGDHRSY